MTPSQVFDALGRYAVIPVIAIESPEAAIPLADALLEGGLPVIEITFRTAAAAEVIAQLCEKRPELLIGAGTVLTPANLQAARSCGARFGVAPGLNVEVVQAAGALGMPFIPGVCTPTEIERGLALGCGVLKFFPAETMGGVEMLKALIGPYEHTGVRFVPTGGVNMQNLTSYLALPAVLAVGGTWIARKEDISARRWREISDRCRQATQAVANARSA